MQGNNSYLLDSSALFTLMEDEPGAERVAEILRSGSCMVPFLAGLEIYYVSLRERGVEEADRRLFLVHQLPSRWLNIVDDTVLVTAGHLKARHRLSLADAMIAAFATVAGAILVHKDPEYDILTTVRQERLPPKGPGGKQSKLD